MNLLDINLAAAEGNWRLFMTRKADAAFLAFQEKVFKRDHYVCQYCGYQSEMQQEVINRDGNYRNNRLSNLVTACPFCAQCFFLEAMGKSEVGGGTLILLPDMTQGELNALCHVLFHSIVMKNSYSSEANNVYRSLRLLAQPVEKQLGEGLSNPALYGQLLIDAAEGDTQALQEQVAQHLRVLPALTKFVPYVEAMASLGLDELQNIDPVEK